MRELIFLALALAALLDGFRPLHGQTSTPAEPTVLRPGDLVRVQVWRRDELSGEFRVGVDSALAHPLYRSVRVVGFPLAEVERRLLAFLEDFETTPRFVMQAWLRVAVQGEVRQPSLYDMPPGTTIAQAVALAGGVSDRGVANEVLLIRGGDRSIVQLNAPDPLTDVTVRSGDQIVVNRRRSVFSEYVLPGATVMGALLSIIGFVAGL